MISVGVTDDSTLSFYDLNSFCFVLTPHSDNTDVLFTCPAPSPHYAHVEIK